MSNAKGKGVAVVTGAAMGIGHGIALRLAADGFDVALGDLPAQQPALTALAEEIRAMGRRAVAVSVDVASEADVRALVESAVEFLGGVDVMVANAGIGFLKSLTEMTGEEFDRVISVNLRGVMLCYKYAAQQMIQQGRGGRIIGASSIAGKKGIPDMSAYSASKFAIRGLTQSAAQELGKHGITVNAYAPGPIMTPMAAMLHAASVKAYGADKLADQGSGSMGPSGGKVATTAEIASLVSFLVSAESHFITGQTINADGGRVFD